MEYRLYRVKKFTSSICAFILLKLQKIMKKPVYQEKKG
jgi:hypothetical protein